MGIVKIKHKVKAVKWRGKNWRCVVYEKSGLEGFSPSVLKIGDIGARAKTIGVIAAVFDLSGFTDFCGQVEPHLVIPKFLKEFLDWLFGAIKDILVLKKLGEESAFYSELPFFAKFMGDGVLFLWNRKDMGDVLICNIINALRSVCYGYHGEFIPKISGQLSYFPKSLKCGAACGNVCSVGKGEDYVGPCINIASRLQKLSSVEFLAWRKGIEFEVGMRKTVKKKWVVKKVPIRGIGEDELVLVLKSDFEELPPEEQGLFKDVDA